MWNDGKIVYVLAGGKQNVESQTCSREVSSARDLELVVQEGLPSESPSDEHFPDDLLRYRSCRLRTANS